jgi:hypothetical protein
MLACFLIALAIVEGQASSNQSAIAVDIQERYNQNQSAFTSSGNNQSEIVLWPTAGDQFDEQGFNQSALISSGAGENSRECVLNTGHTCNFGGCYSWIGDTICDRSAFGFARCFCAPGTCVGADEVCHPGKTNTPPGGEAMTLNDQQVYKLRNARWPDWYAYVSNTGYLWVSRDVDAKSEFTVLVPPRQTEQQPAAPIHLLFSKHWPDSPVFVTHEVRCVRDSNGYTRCYDEYPAVSSRVTGGLFGMLPSPTLTDLGVRFEIAPVENPNPDRTLVMITGLRHAQRYLYVSRGGWQIDSYRTDPGAGGYWYFEPELPQDLQLPRYTGPRCSWACGEVEKLPSLDFHISGAAARGMGVLAASLASIAIALTMWLGAA